jgi:cation transporter-like permease
MIARSGGRMDTPKNYLSIDGNKVMAPTAERQAELEAASGESEDAFDISTPEKAHESLRPGLGILAAHAGFRAIVTLVLIAQLAMSMGPLAAYPSAFLTIAILGSLAGAILSAGLAYGIYRHSRIASVVAIAWTLLLCVHPVIFMFGFAPIGGLFGMALTTPIRLAFVGLPLGALLPLLFNAAMLTTLAWATMANFAWHRFQRGDLADPDVFD